MCIILCCVPICISILLHFLFFFFFLVFISLFFFSFIFISWRLITLQYCSGLLHFLYFSALICPGRLTSVVLVTLFQCQPRPCITTCCFPKTYPQLWDEAPPLLLLFIVVKVTEYKTHYFNHI